MSTMPFGKHKGLPLTELPGGYLSWLAEKFSEFHEPFRSALEAELARRGGAMLPGVANGSEPTPAPRAPARRRAPEAPASAMCAICGLGPTPQKPLVHENCLHDEVPF